MKSLSLESFFRETIMTANQLIIDLSAIVHNYKVLQQWAGPDTHLMGVIKSDAYGHGMIPVAHALESAGCQYFAVFDPLEGLLLRQKGFHQPILILMGVYPDTADEAIANDLISVVYRKDMVEYLSQAACQQGKPAQIQIKVDTGMNRLGVYPEDLAAFMALIQSLPGLVINGFISHFAVSEQPDNAYTERQMQKFVSAISSYSLNGMVSHISNSGGIINHKGLNYPIARAGIAIYGSPPDPGWSESSRLKPAMTFQSEIIYLKTVPPEETISYGRTYTTHKNTRVATLPLGYANGYNRKFSNKAHALVRGTYVPVIGRVCMNLTMIDVTDIPDVGVGDSVVLLGQQAQHLITVDELANHVDTISYEIMCCLGSCNSRVYI
ncbi:MAG: alanine racemase [Candidatus Magnetomorum sp.]|nr:alanine racemase [Candidatus Magnetomorum sp.]